MLGVYATVPCPCEEFLGEFAGQTNRLCTGTLTQGAKWSMELNVTNCETTLSEISKQLCDIAMVNKQC